MDKDPSRTLSDKVEETIEGALRFAVRFFRTIAVILFKPLTCDKILLRALLRNKTYVRPLTFLAIGGFVFSLTISVYPKGFLGLINIIWFNEEVGGVILNRWQEALSISGLLVAAFPVLLTVTATAGLAGRALPLKKRTEFSALNGYLFGYQYFLLFSFFFVAIFVEILRELFGVEVREILGIENFHVNETFKQVLYASLAALFISALLMPTVGLSLWAVRALATRPLWQKAGACASLSIYCIFVLTLCSYTASAPAAFKHLASPKPEKIKIHFLEDPSVRIEEKSEDDKHIAKFELSVAIENVPHAVIIAPKNNLTVGIVGEFKDKKETLASSSDLKIETGGRETHEIVVEKGGLQTFKISGTVDLPNKTYELIRQKAQRPYESNDFGFYINIRLHQGSEVTDRRLFLYADKILE